jgi:hypothetical protein
VWTESLLFTASVIRTSATRTENEIIKREAKKYEGNQYREEENVNRKKR